MTAVAVLGPDGAGKTTIARRLAASGRLPFRYLYMGIAAESSNAALPTTRLVQRLKRTRLAGAAAPDRGAPGRRGRREGKRDRGSDRGPLWTTARLVNRVAEEWYRQLLSWRHQLGGSVVLYDRHFLFDFSPEMEGELSGRLDRRIHRWLLEHAYPRPDLVVLLDAPGDVLFARKGELDPAELERRRQAFLRQADRHASFVRVDATRPLEDVYGETLRLIVEFVEGRGAGGTDR